MDASDVESIVEAVEEESSFLGQIGHYFRSSSFAFLELLVIILFGLAIIRIVMKLVRQALLVSRIDKSLISFIDTIVHFILLLVLLIICLNKMHVNITGIVTLISAMGLAIGLALQDLVSGVANGLVIINTKPFKVDDFVTIGGQSGTVKEISLLHTVLVTTDNKKIVLTNKSVYNSDIVDYSTFANRRLDLTFNVDYNTNIKKAREVIRSVVEAHPLALTNPAPFVRLSDSQDSALIITVRVWVKSENYWDLNWDLREQVLEALKKAKITIPFPQVTVGYRETKEVKK
ncbi:MAG: mechanosensitive ion channel family protein [Spirochaetales bacterium]|nr:mechanosensitive ion channel family protein [Spirochaetales bacterium]